MMASAFAFYRGAAAVMASDLAITPVSGFRAQLCGDAHLLNFGGYASPERDLLFDVNDFDETLPGPWEWDVKRLAASIAIAGRGAGLLRGERRTAIEATGRRYRETMRSLAADTELSVWYAKLNEWMLVDRFRTDFGRKAAPELDRALTKARSKDHLKAFSKLTRMVDGEPSIVADPPIVTPLRDLVPGERSEIEGPLKRLFRTYRQTLQRDRRHLLDRYRIVDIARKVVGVGSVGTSCWILLLMGRDNSDPLFLQVKEAQPSVLAPFAGKSRFSNQGERVVEGQRLMQASSDIFLGWVRSTELETQSRDFYVRQLWDWKVSADRAPVTSPNLAAYGDMCGGILARAHARSGDRIAIAAYLGNSKAFDAALGQFAESYAEQNERDYEEFTAAVRAGALPALEGV